MDELLVLICKEVNMDTGEVSVHEVKTKVDSSTLTYLKLRSRYNSPSLRYFVAFRKNFDKAMNLIRNNTEGIEAEGIYIEL